MERPLGNDVQTGEQRQPFIQHMAHHMPVPGVGEELERQQRTDGAGGGDLLGAGEAGAGEDARQIAGGQIGQEQEQPGELGAELARGQVQPPHVRRIGGHRPHAVGAFLVTPARQPREPITARGVCRSVGRSQRPGPAKAR